MLRVYGDTFANPFKRDTAQNKEIQLFLGV